MVTQETLKIFFTLLRQESGLVLDESKRYLIETRLEPIAVQEGFSSINELGERLQRSPSPFLRQKVVDAMTTNETSFFRDRTPFETLKNSVLPDLIKRNARTRRIRIWCAACSTGQEPYSIAMQLCEMAPDLAAWDVKILATDIAKVVLERASAGVYSQHEVQRGLSTPYLLRFFRQSGVEWRINPEVKRFVEFKRMNLLSNLSSIGVVDVIFCRNLLIYFGLDTKKSVVERMAGVLSPHGALFLGGAETLFGITDRFARPEGNKGNYYIRNGVANT